MIFIECYADETLVKALGINRKKISHAGTKSKVCSQLEKMNKEIGLVDEDPGSPLPPYMDSKKNNNLKLIYNKNDIKVFLDQSKKNTIIILSPRLEEWIIKRAKQAKVQLKKYKLPEKATGLHNIPVNKKELDKLAKLIHDLKSKNIAIEELEKILNRNHQIFKDN